MFAIKLEPGTSTEFDIYRFIEGPLSMELQFRDGGDHTGRPELGDYTTRADLREPGISKFPNPGSAIRIVASVPDAAPVTYEAMPKSGHGPSFFTRNLTPNLSISPGRYKWPPERNELLLHQGTNVVRIKVVAVERPLVGEEVELWVKPSLGFKAGAPSLSWLWPSLLWPILLVFQFWWACALWATGKTRRDTQSQ
ncbi:hypothetical protein JQ596_27860 [Bradyrhizobium manausense]|uniref:hypothetical protein n=1 Tax=Bradyrhizobium TaxID=374 RepID=UPI001BA6B595|nr:MULTISPECIES: hypothetical protein [Bradyrhizobium]MBR0829360.1 hypothetical protein [Bradyrhizobium manausense]UVO25742.1 hypothetical protein KUF59_24500 [Bradyrhizobium arachidis]